MSCPVGYHRLLKDEERRHCQVTTSTIDKNVYSALYVRRKLGTIRRILLRFLLRGSFGIISSHLRAVRYQLKNIRVGAIGADRTAQL